MAIAVQQHSEGHRLPNPDVVTGLQCFLLVPAGVEGLLQMTEEIIFGIFMKRSSFARGQMEQFEKQSGG